MLQSLIRTLHIGRRYTRPVLFVGAIVLGLVLLFQVVAPFLVSTPLVRESMERAVEEWSGHDATIEGTPEVRFWPHPRIVLKDITIRESEDPSSRVIARIDGLSASFKLYQAVRGKPVFEDFHFVRPKIFALRNAGGEIDWSMDGLLNDAVVDTKRAGINALDRERDAVIGDLTIDDGTIEITEETNGQKTVISAVNGTVEWPRLSSGLRLRLGGSLKDRAFSIDLSSGQPLALLAGKNATTDLSVTSDLFSGRFSGTANLASYTFLSGAFNISIPDMAAALHWSEIHVTGLDRLANVTLNAQLMTTGNSLRFEQVALQANEASASGIMDLIATDGARPRLTGTLAFDRLDFSAILAALSPKPDTPETSGVAPAALLGDMLDLDLRLSSNEAQLGPLPLRDAAVSMINTRQMARIDLVGGDIDGGRLTGQISAPAGKLTEGADLKLSLRDADLAAVARRFGTTAILPEANGSVELALHLAKPLGIATLKDMSGSLRVSAGTGRLVGIDTAAIRTLAGKSAYFALKDISDGSLSFNRMDVTASLADGIAEIDEARLDGNDDLVVMSGLVPLETMGLALSANIYGKTAGVPSSTPFMLFVGGAWPTPVFWPMAQP